MAAKKKTKKAKRAKRTKKRKKSKAEALRDDLKATAHKVWLAGLGALAAAEEEGSRAFKTLVDKGEAFEKRSRPRVEKLRKAASDAADTAKGRVEKVADSVGETASKLGDVVDEKITAALHRFGIPTKREIDDLSASVAALTKKIDGVKGRKKATKRKATKRKPAKRKATKRKPAKRKPAKRAARRKPARRKPSKRASKTTSRKTTG